MEDREDGMGVRGEMRNRRTRGWRTPNMGGKPTGDMKIGGKTRKTVPPGVK